MTHHDRPPEKPGQSFQSDMLGRRVIRVGNVIGWAGIGLGVAGFIVCAVLFLPGLYASSGLLVVLLSIVGPVIGLGVAIAALLHATVPLARENRLVREGLPAQATVLRIWDTGNTVNQHPRLELELEVLPADGGSAYRTKTRAVVSRLDAPLYRRGMVVDIRVDPARPNRVALVGPAQSPSQFRLD